MRTLKVLQIASGDLWAGAEAQLYNLCRKLNEFRNIQLHVVLLNQGMLSGELEKTGIPVTVLDERTLSPAGLLRRLASVILKLQPDIIHSHRRKENVLAGLSSFLCPAARCVTTVHGASETPFNPATAYKAIYRLAERLLIALRFSGKIYVSHELQSRLERTSRGGSRVIENGIDIEQTLEKAASFYNYRREPGAKHIGFVGRLVPVKRPDLLLKIAEQTITREKLRYIFHVIGDGPLCDEFRRSVAAKGLSEHVRVHGFCPNPLPLLAGMDCLLITSDHEGLPTNLLEAMCLGVPVVAHAVGEIPRVLDHGRLGILVETQEIDGYVDAIRKCFSPAVPADVAAGLTAKRVQDRYSAMRNAERYFRLYHEVLAPKKRKNAPAFEP